MAKQYNM
jgi:hypothetical protein